MKIFLAALLFVSLSLSHAQFSDEDIERFLRQRREFFDREFGPRFDFESFPRREFPRPSPRLQPLPRLQPTPRKPTSPSKILKLDKSECICRLRSKRRIVNGQIAEANSIPWQVSLASLHNDHFCGASIINHNYILTAAHCVNEQTADEIKVRVGLHNLDDPEIEEKTYYVEEIIQHPWNEDVHTAGDIAILKLTKPITFIPGQVEPACLNTKETQYASELMASGWGTTTITRKNKVTKEIKTGEVSPVLKKAYLNPYTDGCKEFLICVNSDNGDSVCQGDSGGPLHKTLNGKTSVEGVASFVSGSSKNPRDIIVELCTGNGAYSRLSYYENWFKDIVNDNFCTL